MPKPISTNAAASAPINNGHIVLALCPLPGLFEVNEVGASGAP